MKRSCIYLDSFIVYIFLHTYMDFVCKVLDRYAQLYKSWLHVYIHSYVFKISYMTYFKCCCSLYSPQCNWKRFSLSSMFYVMTFLLECSSLSVLTMNLQCTLSYPGSLVPTSVHISEISITKNCMLICCSNWLENASNAGIAVSYSSTSIPIIQWNLS